MQPIQPVRHIKNAQSLGPQGGLSSKTISLGSSDPHYPGYPSHFPRPPKPPRARAEYLASRRSIARRADSGNGFLHFLITMVFPLVTAVCIPLPAFAANYVKTCVNKEVGTYAFGESPAGCDADQFGDVTRINYIYPSMTFNRITARDAHDGAHRKGYVTNVHALIREMAASYIRRRQPGVSDADVRIFTRAILSVATQESYFSHYRWGLDSRLKLMTGDSVDSHGIMQINQKYHASRGQDNSFDLVGNIMYGIEQYYAGWQRAGEMACVKGPKSDPKKKIKGFTAEKIRENRARAAYSAYNGGSGAICRFSNPKHPWAKNDKGWYEKYSEQPWAPWVLDERAKPTVNFECLLEGDDLCAIAEENRGAYLVNRPLVFDDGSTCVTGDGKKLNCTDDLRSFACIPGVSPQAQNLDPLKFEAKKALGMAIVRHKDRSSLCVKTAPGLAVVGEFIKTTVASRIRDGIGGTPIGSVKPGQVFQVLDYEVRTGAKTERFYRIRLDGLTTGYIYGGENSDYAKWAQKTSEAGAGTALLVPRTGSIVSVARKAGIVLKDAPGASGQQLAIVPAQTRLTVTKAVSSGTANEMYLKVEFDGKTGFVYAGRSYPELTIGEWVKVLK